MQAGDCAASHLFVTVVSAGALLAGAGVCGRAGAAPARKVQDALELAVVEEEVERPHVAHLACAHVGRHVSAAGRHVSVACQ